MRWLRGRRRVLNRGVLPEILRGPIGIVSVPDVPKHRRLIPCSMIAMGTFVRFDAIAGNIHAISK